MIFLIEYDRLSGTVVQLVTFADADRASAQNSRLEKELDLNRSRLDHEVVLLEAVDEDALRRTHRRYFETLSQLSQPRATEPSPTDAAEKRARIPDHDRDDEVP